jgi:hypothetical protein
MLSRRQKFLDMESPFSGSKVCAEEMICAKTACFLADQI